MNGYISIRGEICNQILLIVNEGINITPLKNAGPQFVIKLSAIKILSGLATQSLATKKKKPGEPEYVLLCYLVVLKLQTDDQSF